MVKESLDTEVEDFNQGFWQGAGPVGGVYLDKPMHLYKQLGGGEVKKETALSFFMDMLNPWSTFHTPDVAARWGVKGNLKGEGFQKGGLYVLSKGGTMAYAYPEKKIGDRAPFHEVVGALKGA